MIEEIRNDQKQQGYEPCFATTRMFQEEWVVKNCIECIYRPHCLRALHSIIVSIHAGTSELPFSEKKRIMDEARNSPVVRKITALAESGVPMAIENISVYGVSGARDGEQLNRNLKKKGKKNVPKKDH